MDLYGRMCASPFTPPLAPPSVRALAQVRAPGTELGALESRRRTRSRWQGSSASQGPRRSTGFQNRNQERYIRGRHPKWTVRVFIPGCWLGRLEGSKGFRTLYSLHEQRWHDCGLDVCVSKSDSLELRVASQPREEAEPQSTLLPLNWRTASSKRAWSRVYLHAFGYF